MRLVQITFYRIYFICFLLIWSLNGQAQDYTKKYEKQFKYQILQQNILNIANRHHYNKNTIKDAEFVDSFFEQYLKSLDPNKDLFLLEDIKRLENYKKKIITYIQKGDLTFFNLIESIYKKRLNTYKTYARQILTKPFEYSGDEYYNTDFEHKNYCKKEKEQEKRWVKGLKWYSIDYYYNLLEQQTARIEANQNDSTFKVKDQFALEGEARSTTLKNLNNRFSYLEQQNPDERYAIYINSILSIYDPHTEYLPPAKKEDFDITMSGKFEGIGAVLQKTEGNIKVVRIIPGGAAWRQKELKGEDIILKVAQENSEAPVSITNMSLRDAVSLIRGKKNSTVRLTVKKLDGTIKIIPIVRDVVVLEESYIKYITVEDKKINKKYGYIDVPVFYHDFSDKKGARVSEDVKKAIEDFKKEGIDGLIIDLQTNGGGSLAEAIEMSGLFIEGPVVQVKNSANQTKAYRPQVNQKPIYDGPIVVLINHYSASASEIFAAAIQDYQRGVIVGSPVSYGKGTVQQIINLDNAINSAYSSLNPFGALKLTFEKFYRVNGSTTQNIGVTPDIILPDIYSKLGIGERAYKYALKADSISRVFYYTSDNYNNNTYDYLRKKSASRIQNNEIFSEIIQTAQLLKERNDQFRNTLNYEKLKKEKEYLKGFKRTFTQEKDKDFKLLPIVKNQGDKQEVAFADDWANKILTDPYLLESMYILRDQNAMKE